MPARIRNLSGLYRELRIFYYAAIVALALMTRSILIDLTEISIEIAKLEKTQDEENLQT
jgi:hypothetical protein